MRTVLIAVAAVCFLASAAAWAQVGIPNGCAPGIPNTVQSVLTLLGVPGCGAGVPSGGSSSGPPPVGCVGTGYDFTKSCNSQYIVVL